MFLVGYNTPFRIVLLLLIRRFCKYDFPEELISHFIVYIVNSVLNEDQCKKTCSEPSLKEVGSQIMSFIEDPGMKARVEDEIMSDLETIEKPYNFDEFMCSLGNLIDRGSIREVETEEDDMGVLNKTSVLGLFVRKCRVSYEQLAPTHMSDIHGAFLEYVEHKRGDAELTNIKDETATGWVSDYNVKEFLKYQAEQIEITGTTNISTTDLHRYLVKMETQLPSLINIRQVRYLNYIRSKEYTQSLFYLHLWSDTSLEKGVGIQYAQLNAGILEYKFGHYFNALLALNDALAAARFNKDEFCLQEVQYWIELCRKEQPFNVYSSYTDPYLKNLKTLSKTRNMLQNGHPCRNVFENLYRSHIDITTNNIKYIHRVQFLITSLAWKRYGNDVMANLYLELAYRFGGDSVEEIENTAIVKATKAQELGDYGKALKEIQTFIDNYKDEKDVLVGWRQAKARLLKQLSGKRTHDSIEYDENVLQFATPLNTEEYFLAVYDRARDLIQTRETDKALDILNNVYDFIQKTHQMSLLSPNLILQATIHLSAGSVRTAISTLEEAMKLAKKHHDSKNYYSAVIKLSEAYLRLRDTESVEKALYMLESIFPKVLLVGSKLLESDLNLVYAIALDASFLDTETREPVLECIVIAEQGYRQLNLEHDLLKALYFKLTIQGKMGLQAEKNKTLEEMKALRK